MADFVVGIEKFIPVFQEYAAIYLCLKKISTTKPQNFGCSPVDSTVNNDEKFYGVK